MSAQLLSLDQSYRSAGVSRYVRALLGHLPSADGGLSYHAFVGDPRIACPGWTCHATRWPTARPTVRVLWEQLLQPWEARRRRLDLLHAPVYVGPLAARCPLVVSVHDLSFFRYPELFRQMNRRYLQPFTRATAHRAEVILASSQSTGRDVVEILGVPEARVRVVPLGVEDAMQPVGDARALERFRLERGLPPRMILYVGTLEPRKNLVTLVEAYARLAAQPGFAHRLVIAGGKGWYYEEIYATVTHLGLRDRVLFPGYVPDEELRLWYAAADLFVYPSLYEGFGLPPLEAMACGTPVVASDASCLPEVVGDAGLLVPPHDVDALAGAMRRMLEDGELAARCRARGRERAGRFTWAEAARRTAVVYRQVLGSR